MRIPTDQDKAYVELLLDEALKDYITVIDPVEYKVIRTTIRDELLFHPDGQKLVREAQEDPSVDVSGKITKRLQAMTGELGKVKGGAS